MISLLAIFVAIIAFCSLGKSNAQAAVLLFDEGTNLRNNGSGNWGGTVGVRFTVGDAPIQVTSLGLWDGPNPGGSEGDGLEVGTEVGLWNDSQVLLASVSIAQGTAGSQVDGSSAYCAFESLTTPVTLSANTNYRVGALYSENGNAFMNNGGSFDTSVNVFQGVYNSFDSYLDWPGSQDGNNRFGSATMQFSEVPIPAAVWLLGSGLIGLVGIRRKFKG